jgi:hypothetical protein
MGVESLAPTAAELNWSLSFWLLHAPLRRFAQSGLPVISRMSVLIRNCILDSVVVALFQPQKRGAASAELTRLESN